MPARRWRLALSPVGVFLAVGLVALVAIIVGARVLTTRAAHDEALMDAQATTQLLARSVAEPLIPRGLAQGKPGAVDRFDRVATDRLVVGDVRRIKIWAADGTIVYSDDVRLIGERFALDDEELAILEDGGSDAEVRARPAGEPVRAGRAGAGRGLHPGVDPGGPAAALRGLLHPGTDRGPPVAGDRPLPEHHAGRAGPARRGGYGVAVVDDRADTPGGHGA